MSDEQLIDRIGAWEAAGLIDGATAGRLAAFEQSRSSANDSRSRRPALASLFGPAVSAGEMLAYLGAAFLLAAWHVFARASSGDYSGAEDFGREALQFAVPAILLATVGVLLHGESARRSRAAGVSFVVATSEAAFAVWFVIQAAAPGVDRDLLLVLATLAGVLTAAAFRRVHPAVLTQLGLLGALWTFASAGLTWLDQVIYPRPDFSYGDSAPIDSGAALLRVALTAAWWLGWTVVFGAIALVEARTAATLPDSTDGIEADRRASASRFVAGLVAVSGTTFAVAQSNGYERVLEPWLGDIAILAVAGALVVVAFRRASSAYLYPAAIGLIIALSDVNAKYVASTSGTATALLVEGLMLLAAGLAADRLRRRLGRADDGAASPPTPATSEPVPSA